MTRAIHSRFSSRQLPDLLQALLIAELISPSPCLWLVSPWVSDIPIIDNTANTFLALEPTWPRSKIRLAQTLSTLTHLGTTVCIATRPDNHNRGFIDTLSTKASTKNLRIHQAEELHTKGMLSDAFFLAGSMNFTFNGISVNEEFLIYETDSAKVSEQKINFRDRWGGEAA